MAKLGIGTQKDIPNPPVDEILRKMEPWETNHQCLKSIRYKHEYQGCYAQESKHFENLKQKQREADREQ